MGLYELPLSVSLLGFRIGTMMVRRVLVSDLMKLAIENF